MSARRAATPPACGESVMGYRLVRSRRGGLRLRVEAGGEVVVRAPPDAPPEEVARFVASNESWIRANVQRLASMRRPPPRRFEDGESYLLLGEPLRLAVREDDGWVRAAPGGVLLLPARLRPMARTAVEDWYIRQAEAHIPPRTRAMAAKAGVSPASVSIGRAMRRWGSCANTGALRFTWRLVMAPPWVIDSVIGHELGHLTRMDHSAAFRRAAERAFPGHKAGEGWLAANGWALAW